MNPWGPASSTHQTASGLESVFFKSVPQRFTSCRAPGRKPTLGEG